MALFAAKSLIERYKAKYKDTSQDDPKDFMVEAEDGEMFPVHSTVLMIGSEFFNRAVNSPFRENKTRTLKLPYSSTSVEMMIKFLYGYELEKVKSVKVVKEIVEMARMYEIKFLEEAVSIFIDDSLTKEDVVDCIIAFDKVGAEEAFKECCQHITVDEVVKNNQLLENPSALAKVLKTKKESPQKEPNYFKLFDPMTNLTRKLGSTYKTVFYVDRNITLQRLDLNVKFLKLGSYSIRIWNSENMSWKDVKSLEVWEYLPLKDNVDNVFRVFLECDLKARCWYKIEIKTVGLTLLHCGGKSEGIHEVKTSSSDPFKNDVTVKLIFKEFEGIICGMKFSY